MMSMTRRRGFSEAKGSWKIIRISERTGRSCDGERWAMSTGGVPKRMRPSVGSSTRTSAWPSVVLPQPDSPTTLRVSPARMSSEMPSTARTWPTVCRKTPPVIGKCTLRFSARIRISPSLIRRPSGASGTREGSRRWQAAKWPAPSSREAGSSTSQRPGTASGQRVLKGQPVGRFSGCGTMPSIAVSRWPRPRRAPSFGIEPSSASV